MNYNELNTLLKKNLEIISLHYLFVQIQKNKDDVPFKHETTVNPRIIDIKNLNPIINHINRKRKRCKIMSGYGIVEPPNKKQCIIDISTLNPIIDHINRKRKICKRIIGCGIIEPPNKKQRLC